MKKSCADIGICCLFQYKFLVDGEWRHNEQLPFVTGNCGIVNTVFLTGEPDTVPTSFSPETSGRSNMDVDNEVFTRMVSFCLRVRQGPMNCPVSYFLFYWVTNAVTTIVDVSITITHPHTHK